MGGKSERTIKEKEMGDGRVRHRRSKTDRYGAPILAIHSHPRREHVRSRHGKVEKDLCSRENLDVGRGKHERNGRGERRRWTIRPEAERPCLDRDLAVRAHKDRKETAVLMVQ